MAQIVGRSYLPGPTLARPGRWEAMVDASVSTGVPGFGTSGTQDIVSGLTTARDNGAGATMTLANGWYLFRYVPDTHGSAPNDGPTPWMRYQVTGNTTWKAVVDAQPVGPPPAPDLAAQVASDRAAAEAAAASVQREQNNGVAGLDPSGRIFDTRVPTRLTADQLGLTYARTANRPVTLRDNAAIDFTGASDSRSALRAAIDAAGAGTPVEIGRSGVIRCDSPLGTLPQFQTLSGAGLFDGIGGGTAATELRFPTLTADQEGITLDNNTLADLVIRGPNAGDANATSGVRSISGSPKFHRVNWIGWTYAARLADAYYTTFDHCVWSRNAQGIRLDASVYNLDVIKPAMYCSYGSGDSLKGLGINGGARGLKVYGGSIEGYGTGGAVRVVSNISTHLDGVYFETDATNAWGLNCDGAVNASVSLTNCEIYLDNHNRFTYLGGFAGAFNAWGNTYLCGAGSSTVPTAYYFDPADVGNIRGAIGHDNWSSAFIQKAGTAYMQPFAMQMGPIPDLDVRVPGRRYLDGHLAFAGNPNGNVNARETSLCTDFANGILYRKTTAATSNTGWVAVG